VLVAAAVCPHPPLLIPAAVGAAGWAAGAAPGDGTGGGGEPQPDDDAVLPRVRAACHAAVAGLVLAQPDLIVVVGGAAAAGEYGGPAAGGLQEFGVPVTIGTGPPVLPLSLTVGAWLLRGCGLPGSPGEAQPGLRLHAVATSTPAPDCLRLGAQLAAAAPRVALLAMGDGSARKATGVPGAPDPVADRYDADVAAALAAADPGPLARLDAALDDVLSVAGRAAWQVLAGAAAGGQLRGTLRCAAAPFGVSYLVASWDCLAAGPLTD
jgi:hypothetical protein